MRWKGKADGVALVRMDRMQPQDAQRHRQSAAPFEDTHQIGVARIVVVIRIAAKAAPGDQQRFQRFHLHVDTVRSGGAFPRFPRDLGERPPVRIEALVGPIERCQEQRRFRYIDGIVVARSDLAQRVQRAHALSHL